MELLAQRGEVVVAFGIEEAGAERGALHHHAVAGADGEVALAVAVHAGIAAVDHGDGDRGVVADRDRPVRERVRRDGHEQERGELGREDRAARRERVGGGAGGRGDDDAVGAHRVGEAAVDLHRALDHAAERAAIDDDVVERQRLVGRTAGPLDRDLEQRAPLLDVASVEHGAERGGHLAHRDVGEEAEPSLVDADQRHVEGRQLAREREHRAVAAQHDREVGLRGELGGGGGHVARQRRVLRGAGVEHDAMAARGEECRQLGERPRDRGRRVAADEGDAGKAVGGR